MRIMVHLPQQVVGAVFVFVSDRQHRPLWDVVFTMCCLGFDSPDLVMLVATVEIVRYCRNPLESEWAPF